MTKYQILLIIFFSIKLKLDYYQLWFDKVNPVFTFSLICDHPRRREFIIFNYLRSSGLDNNQDKNDFTCSSIKLNRGDGTCSRRSTEKMEPALVYRLNRRDGTCSRRLIEKMEPALVYKLKRRDGNCSGIKVE